MTWFLLAVILLIAAILCHLAASFHVPAAIDWTSLAWALTTGAVLALLLTGVKL